MTPALADQFSRGVADLKAGNLDAAEAAFRGILRDGGDAAPVHHNLGIVLQQRKHYEQALAEFDAASRIDPSVRAGAAPCRHKSGRARAVSATRGRRSNAPFA